MTEQIAQVNEHIQIAYDTFGLPEHPALLLIMGACCQKIFWSEKFCQSLAGLGLFVIRYDHRDTGHSSAINFNEQPYDTNDMADDALALLRVLNVTQAHVLGLSLGGTIAQLLQSKAPDMIRSLILVSSSCDYYPLFNALKGTHYATTRPSPTDEYVELMTQAQSDVSSDETLMLRVRFFKLMRTPAAFSPEEEIRMQQTFLHRQQNNPSGHFNHLDAELRALDIINQAPEHVNAPTLIIHGAHDCIFPVDHGRYLQQQIEGSELLIINDMGHVPGEKHAQALLSAVKEKM